MSEEIKTIDVSMLTGLGENVDESSSTETTSDTSDTDTEKDEKFHYVINPDIYVYFDMEFTGLRKDASLISIGLCTAQGHSFYAEFVDFDFTKVTPWILDNVLKELTNPPTHLEGDHWTMRGTRTEIIKNLLYWLDAVHSHTGCGIQFVGDVGHYDFVFLIDLLWGDALSMPEWINADVVNISQDLANVTHEVMNKSDTADATVMEYNPYYAAFNTDRIEYVKHLGVTDTTKHNALMDAYNTRLIHQHLWDIQVPFSPLDQQKVEQTETAETGN